MVWRPARGEDRGLPRGQGGPEEGQGTWGIEGIPKGRAHIKSMLVTCGQEKVYVQSNLKKGFLVAHSLRAQAHHGRKAWQQERERAGHVVILHCSRKAER